QEKKKSKRPLFIVAGLLLIMGIIGAGYWIYSSHYVSTDDAQLDGNIYSVRSSVTAYLDEIRFQDNEFVHQGDTLMVFNTTALKAEVEKTRAALANARTNLSVSDIKALAKLQNAKASKQSNAAGKEAIEAAHSQLKKAQQDVERDEKLVKIDAITPQQSGTDKNVLVQAKTAYQKAVQHYQSTITSTSSLQSLAKAAHHNISAVAAQVEQCKAQLRLAQQNLRHAYVIAPCNGIVTKRSVDPGQYVMAGQSLCAVVDADNLWVTANFKETKLNDIEIGQAVKISVDAFPNLTLKGKVQSFSGATGAKFALIPPDNATGNFIKVTQRFPLRITIDSTSLANNKPDRLREDLGGESGRPNSRSDKSLFPGLSVEVKIKVD